MKYRVKHRIQRPAIKGPLSMQVYPDGTVSITGQQEDIVYLLEWAVQCEMAYNVEENNEPLHDDTLACTYFDLRASIDPYWQQVAGLKITEKLITRK